MGAKESSRSPPGGDQGFVTAAVLDQFGNMLGVMYNPHYLEILQSPGEGVTARLWHVTSWCSLQGARRAFDQRKRVVSCRRFGGSRLRTELATRARPRSLVGSGRVRLSDIGHHPAPCGRAMCRSVRSARVRRWSSRRSERPPDGSESALAFSSTTVP